MRNLDYVKLTGIKMYLESHPDSSVSAIAKRYNISRPTAYKYIEKIKVENSSIIKKDNKLLIDNYFSEHPDDSVYKCAKAIGLSYPTVKKYRFPETVKKKKEIRKMVVQPSSSETVDKHESDSYDQQLLLF